MRDALDAARQVDRPGHRVRLGRIDLVDHRHLRLGQVLVPAELLEHAEGEFGIAVLDLRILGVGAVGQQADLHGRAIRPLLLALDAEARAEGAAAVHGGEIGVVEQRRARMLDLRRAPARPRQAVVVAALGSSFGARMRDHVELGFWFAMCALSRSGDWPQ